MRNPASPNGTCLFKLIRTGPFGGHERLHEQYRRRQKRKVVACLPRALGQICQPVARSPLRVCETQHPQSVKPVESPFTGCFTHFVVQRREQISDSPIPCDVDRRAKIQIHRRDRGGWRECKRGNAEPIAGGIDVTVSFVDYIVQFHFSGTVSLDKQEHE